MFSTPPWRRYSKACGQRRRRRAGQLGQLGVGLGLAAEQQQRHAVARAARAQRGDALGPRPAPAEQARDDDARAVEQVVEEGVDVLDAVGIGAAHGPEALGQLTHRVSRREDLRVGGAQEDEHDAAISRPARRPGRWPLPAAGGRRADHHALGGHGEDHADRRPQHRLHADRGLAEAPQRRRREALRAPRGSPGRISPAATTTARYDSPRDDRRGRRVAARGQPRAHAQRGHGGQQRARRSSPGRARCACRSCPGRPPTAGWPGT